MWRLGLEVAAVCAMIVMLTMIESLGAKVKANESIIETLKSDNEACNASSEAWKSLFEEVSRQREDERAQFQQSLNEQRDLAAAAKDRARAAQRELGSYLTRAASQSGQCAILRDMPLSACAELLEDDHESRR